MRIAKQKAEAAEDQEDLKLVMERRGGPITRITLGRPIAKQHPLTDEIIREELITRDECDRRLDYGYPTHYEEDFRAGADWQFEEDLRELLRILIKVQKKIGSVDVLDEVYFQFMDKMRPQG